MNENISPIKTLNIINVLICYKQYRPIRNIERKGKSVFIKEIKFVIKKWYILYQPFLDN